MGNSPKWSQASFSFEGPDADAWIAMNDPATTYSQPVPMLILAVDEVPVCDFVSLSRAWRD